MTTNKNIKVGEVVKFKHGGMTVEVISIEENTFTGKVVTITEEGFSQFRVGMVLSSFQYEFYVKQESVKIIKKLQGEFVTAEVVKTADQKDYNQAEWNKTVDSYSKYKDVKFLKVPGTIYAFDYWVTCIVDGIRFLSIVSYSSSLSSAGFTYGFITYGMKDKEAYKKVIEIMPELIDCDKDSFTIMSFANNGRLPNNKAGRDHMRIETKESVNRFYTNDF